jgi:hypothetical protein
LGDAVLGHIFLSRFDQIAALGLRGFISKRFVGVRVVAWDLISRQLN